MSQKFVAAASPCDLAAFPNFRQVICRGQVRRVAAGAALCWADCADSRSDVSERIHDLLYAPCRATHATPRILNKTRFQFHTRTVPCTSVRHKGHRLCPPVQEWQTHLWPHGSIAWVLGASRHTTHSDDSSSEDDRSAPLSFPVWNWNFQAAALASFTDAASSSLCPDGSHGCSWPGSGWGLCTLWEPGMRLSRSGTLFCFAASSAQLATAMTLSGDARRRRLL